MTSAETRTGPAVSLEMQRDFLRSMLEIRLFEDQCHRLFAQGLVRGSTHLCQGQEAVAVGGCRALQDGDSMTCTYRGHGAVLAMGAPLDRAFAEILGKAGGLCRGKGGSMHLTDVSVGAFGSFAIVGAHLPIATGLAFASRYRGSKEISLCFFGDGTTNIGAFHEALNLAAIWKLPVVFVCENNLYGEYSPVAWTTPVEQLASRAESYAMARARIDGNAVLEVHAAIGEAAMRARAGEGPTLVEALTYRQQGHSRSDPGAYRPPGELDAWLERDPILLHERHLRDAGMTAEELASLHEHAQSAVAAALAEAMSWKEPDPASRLEDVYA